MREGTIFQLALKPKDFPAGMRLRNIEWGVLFALDGTTPIGQIRRAFNIPEEELEGICGQLLENGLIKEKPVSLSEYMAAQTAASGKKTLSLLEMLQGGTAIRALTLDTGKGTPLNAGPRTPGPVQEAKITPPPVPPEALAGAAPGDQAGITPVSAGDGAAGGSSPASPLLPPVGVNGVGAPSAASTARPLTSAFTTPISHKPIASAAAASTASLGKTTPVLGPPTSSAAFSTSHRSTETDTAGATASIIHPAPTNRGLAAASVLPMEDRGLDQAVATKLSPSKVEVASGTPSQFSPLPAGNARRRLSLKNVIEFIITRVDDLNAGQLDVYRVFIRVNTRLLKRNGVHSLRFEEDRVITDIELQDAILASVERTLGVSCPPSVFL